MGELIRLLHSNSDDSPSSVQTPTVQTTPKTEDNPYSCDEEILMETTKEAQEGEDPHSSPKHRESPSLLDLGDAFPCDNHFVETVLHDLSVGVLSCI